MEDFIERMRSMNLRSDDTIVIYDNYGIYSAPRMAWTLRYFGAENVKVLNGGLKKWVQERR
jgi:thiosulfate/3-mercaptopyruvate sulfurtransferase